MTDLQLLGVWKREDVALLLIDYQEEMFANIRSTTPADLVELNVRLLIRTAKAFDIPIILSTVGVGMGVNKPTRAAISDELPGITIIDRSSMNAWEDDAFLSAVKATGKRRLVFGALYTEICLAFPVVDALKDGYDVSYVVDAVGGMSALGHDTAITRMAHAGAVPNTAVALVTELFRDWKDPVSGKVREIVGWYLSEHARLTA